MKSLVTLRSQIGMMIVACFFFALVPMAVQAAVLFNGRIDSSSRSNPVDSRPDCFYNVHEVLLTAGTQYVITLRSRDFDAYLILAGNGVLVEDDDGDGNLNARIVFTPTVTGTYRLYATTFSAGATGAYRLNVRP